MDSFAGGTYVFLCGNCGGRTDFPLAFRDMDLQLIKVRAGQRLVLEHVFMSMDANQGYENITLFFDSNGTGATIETTLFTWTTKDYAVQSISYPSPGAVVACPETTASCVSHSNAGLFLRFSPLYNGYVDVTIIGRVIGR
jgi:hypothetical protein